MFSLVPPRNTVLFSLLPGPFHVIVSNFEVVEIYTPFSVEFRLKHYPSQTDFHYSKYNSISPMGNAVGSVDLGKCLC